MRRLDGFGAADAYRGCVVAIGNFDGVHRGHQVMLERLKSHATKYGVPAVVFTFHPHPIKLLRPAQTPPPLSTLERKLELLEEYGVDVVIAYPTDRELLELSAEEFFQQIVCDELQARGMVEGPNFFFGKNRSGDIHRLAELCQRQQMFLEIVEPEKIDGLMISSSRIRELVSKGQIRAACELLGHPYQISGVVTKGAGRGRELGFPTANLTEIPTLLPPAGVYGGVGYLDSNSFSAAINIGPNPTFGDERLKVEVHLIGCQTDLYDQTVKVDLLGEIREVRKFATVDELKDQVQSDLRSAESLVSSYHQR
ncbi:MAG: bifunctional riboflavin kinase/FAD synthetase [Planctomycetaceae bacterium]|nr:bifunctional riboflavin kinase/FAD synthetase [Planctomycetaceae bacterium]